MLRNIILSIMMTSLPMLATALNEYQATYGLSNIIPYSKIYPDFIHSPKLQPPLIATSEIHVVVASTKEVKINAARNFFSSNPHFKDKKIIIQGVTVASNVAEQPIGLDNAILGSRNRIKNAKNTVLKDTAYYVAIENFFSELTPGVMPTDHAVVIIETPTGEQYTYLSEGVEVSPSIYNLVVTPSNLAADGTGANSSIGDYLFATYNIIPADWFAFATGKPYTREQQILTAFALAH